MNQIIIILSKHRENGIKYKNIDRWLQNLLLADFVRKVLKKVGLKNLELS